MRFKRLYLQGYKTFANKTEFLFDEGITAIVGPNGSGKSNIADAVRWVLGEQSYSELRGRRGVDMIFSGSQSRPRAGMAHASLVLDNSDGWLAIEFAEVEIGRRVYRDGQNEYYLNGQKVRLKDITNLLATSGLAGRTYTMIGQGLVDRALSLKADERRALFEEAAGISHYKDRRAETLRRLQETQRNLERVHDILEEIRPRMRSLQRQATRAQNFEQVQRDLHELLRVWYGYQWDASRVKLRLRREAASGAEGAWKASRRRLEQISDQVETLRLQINRAQQRIHQREAERDQIRDELETTKRTVAILRERQAAVTAQLAELDRELPELAQQRLSAESELSAALTDLQTAQADRDAEQQQLVTFEASYSAQQMEIKRRQSTVQTLENDERQARQRLAQAQGQLTQLRERLAEYQAQPNADAETAAAQARVTELTSTLAELEEKLSTHRAEQKALYAQHQEQIRTLKQLRRDSAELTRRLNQSQQRVAKLETRVDLLDDMRHKPAKVRGDAAILKTFANDLIIPDRYQIAIEAALADELGTLLVGDSADLWRLVEANDKQHLLVAIEAALTPFDPVPTPDHPDVIGWANAFVDVPDDVNRLGDYLLQHVLLVETRQCALAVASALPRGTQAVALDGFVVRAGGLVETGLGNTGNALLQRERDWRAARADLDAAQAEMAALEAEASALDANVTEKQAAADTVNDQLRRLDILTQGTSRQISDRQRDLDRAQQQLAFIERRYADQTQEINRLTERITTLSAELEPQQATIVQLESAVADARLTLQALPSAEADQQRTQLRQSLAATRTIVAGRQAVVDSRRATLGQIESRLQRQQARHTDLMQQKATIDLAGTAARRDALQQQMDALVAVIEPLRSERTAQLDRITDLESDLALRQKEAHKLETNYTEARVALTQQENVVEGLKERVRADLGLVDLAYEEDETVQTPLPIAEVVEKLPRVEALPEGIEESISKRRGQLQRMGAINPDAPQEYAETQARHDFLEQQLADLDKTEEQLREVIAELDGLTSREFARTVEEVNGVFNVMFTRLFGGGSAELTLTEPDDLTITGVDIIARLPRRRPQGLALLSGGERALTAAALIFALLTVAPPPFCVMDEVDAALDEANINRFRDALRQLAADTQFIVITHNRGTVQAAETIYGISMQQDGTSQVISLKAEDYVSDRAGQLTNDA